MENINNPMQPQTEFDYAFGDELNTSGEDLTTNQENLTKLAKSGLISRIIGTKKSRQNTIKRITSKVGSAATAASNASPTYTDTYITPTTTTTNKNTGLIVVGVLVIGTLFTIAIIKSNN
jgi:hypothetical protein